MPPRKRARPGSRAPSTLSIETQTTTIGATPVVESPIKSATKSPAQKSTTKSPAKSAAKSDAAAMELPPLDRWTDEEEISLFRAIVKWKPAGMHKHIRIIAISKYMQDRGHDPKDAPHTRIPGIWRKLRSLYNLDAIDERENSIFEPDEESGDRKTEPFRAFALPQEEYGTRMFDKRLASERSSSPSFLDKPPSSAARRGARGRGNPSAGRAARASTVEDTEEEPKTTVPPTQPRKSARTQTRATRANPKAKASPEPKQSLGKRKRKAHTQTDDEVEEDPNAGDDEGVREEEPSRDNSTAAGSPATGSSAVASKVGKTPAKQQDNPGGMDLRRSSRKK